MPKKTEFTVTINVEKLNDLIRTEPEKARDVVRRLAEDGKNHVILSFNTSPPGRSYPRGSGRVHIASKEGYPPNVDTGVLKAGISTEPRGRFQWSIVSAAEYSAWVEFGTSRMGSRPYMRPMAEWLRKQVADAFDDYLK